jgi:uncharacterized membrane protein YphA (DoxX/SURF4 family)
MMRVGDASLLVGRLVLAGLVFAGVGVPEPLVFGYYGPKLGYLVGAPVLLYVATMHLMMPVMLVLGLMPRMSALLLILYVSMVAVLDPARWVLHLAVVVGLLCYLATGPGAWAARLDPDYQPPWPPPTPPFTPH